MTDAQFKKLLAEALAAQDQRLDKRMDEQLATFFGQMSGHFDERLDTELSPMRESINRINTSLDTISKSLDDDAIERAALGHQLHRHEGWIGQLAKATNTKLVPEQ